MPSSFEQRFQTNAMPRLNERFGVEVTLARGVYTTESFTARRNEKNHTAMGAQYGIEIDVVMRDFLLPVASVVIEGLTTKPKRLDQVLEIATGETFEILSPDDKTPAVELMPGGYEWLVHTKKIEVDP